MSSGISGLHVLVIGLDPYRVPGPWDPEPVARAIESGMAELFDHGIDADACLVALDGSDDIEAIVVADLLVKRWDCVVVGGGIRHSEELLELFETVINLIRRHAPSAEIVFNRAPERLLEAVLRRSPSD